MASKFNLVMDAHPVMALPPAADAAGRAGQWVSAKDCDKVYCVAEVNQGNAAPVALTFQQAKDASGTGAKALSGNAYIWANQAQAQAAGGDTLTRQTPAAGFTTSAATGAKKVVFELILEDCLDINNGYCYFQLSTGASNAANITAANYFCIPGRFAQDIPPCAVI